MNNQALRVLALLRRKRSSGLMPMEALERIGVYRLAARIFELREAGYGIETIIEEVQVRNGGTARVARYVLVKEA